MKAPQCRFGFEMASICVKSSHVQKKNKTHLSSEKSFCHQLTDLAKELEHFCGMVDGSLDCQ